MKHLKVVTACNVMYIAGGDTLWSNSASCSGWNNFQAEGGDTCATWTFDGGNMLSVNNGYSASFTKYVSTKGYNNVRIQYDLYPEGLEGKEDDFCYVKYSTNGGANWVTAATYDDGDKDTLFNNQVINCNAAADNNANFRVRFQAVNDGGSESKKHDWCNWRDMMVLADFIPTPLPTTNPTTFPSDNPTITPTKSPTDTTPIPSISPSKYPSHSATKYTTKYPSKGQTKSPTSPPTHREGAVDDDNNPTKHEIIVAHLSNSESKEIQLHFILIIAFISISLFGICIGIRIYISKYKRRKFLKEKCGDPTDIKMHISVNELHKNKIKQTMDDTDKHRMHLDDFVVKSDSEEMTHDKMNGENHLTLPKSMMFSAMIKDLPNSPNSNDEGMIASVGSPSCGDIESLFHEPGIKQVTAGGEFVE